MTFNTKYGLDYFAKKNLAFALIKNSKVVYKSQSQGFKPLVFCLKKYKKEMKGAIVFDKIVGLAAAKLLSYGKVKEVWAPLISRGALKYLAKNKIKVDFRKEVKNILNHDGSDLCLMETMCRRKALKEFLRDLNIYY